MQGDPPARSSARHLPESEAQAARGLENKENVWHVLQVSIFRRRKACGSVSRRSMVSGRSAPGRSPIKRASTEIKKSAILPKTKPTVSARKLKRKAASREISAKRSR